MTTEVAQAKTTDLRWMADAYMQIQEARKAMKNRARAAADGDDPHGGEFAYERGEELHAIEREIFKEMVRTARCLPIYTEWLVYVRGIGPTYTTKLLAWPDIEKANTVSAFWKYFGMGVEMVCTAGKDERCTMAIPVYNDDLETVSYKALKVPTMEPRKPMRTAKMTDEAWEEMMTWYGSERRKWQGVGPGDPCPLCGSPVVGEAQKKRSRLPLGYNRKLKSLMWNITKNFMLNDSSYRIIYDREKAKKVAEGWGKSDGHRDRHAKRKMGKIFLSHLWVKWREAEGLPIRDPYVIEHTKHNDYYSPEEFVTMS